MTQTGVPGVAVAVVYQDKVVYAKGFGVREVGKPDKVDPDTVFQVASVSKPVASTIVAGVVGRKTIAWDDPVIKYNPAFALHDPYVTANASFADLMSHRSGLYTGSGDLLEDLGFDQGYILSKLNQQPLDPFRASYNYSNFGYTEGGVAAADAAKQSWDALAQDVLFAPLGMTESSYQHSVYESRQDKALSPRAGRRTRRARPGRRSTCATPTPRRPAGGLSSSVRDLAQFVRLQLGAGKVDGKQVIDPAALQADPRAAQRSCTRRSNRMRARSSTASVGTSRTTARAGSGSTARARSPSARRPASRCCRWSNWASSP